MTDLLLEAAQVDGAALLDDWQWLLEGEKIEVVAVTVMGDAFLESPSGEVLFLDTLEGTVQHAASSRATLFSLLNSGEVPAEWFNADMVELKLMQGERLKPGQCYSYKIPPILSGPLESSNVEACDLLVHFSIAGQLHRQVRDLPPGTKITKINIVEPRPAKARRGPLTRLLQRTRKLGLRLRSRAAE